MRGEWRQGSTNVMEAWQEARERRIQALEVENQELRRQLDELRRGIGVAVVIAGRTMPLAAVTPNSPSNESRPMPAQTAQSRPYPVAHPQASSQASLPTEYAFEQPWSQPVTASQPMPTPQSRSPIASMPTTHMPVPPVASTRKAPRTGNPDNSWLTDQHPATPSADEAPRPRTASRSAQDDAAWLRSGLSWPEPAPANPIAPIGQAFPPPSPLLSQSNPLPRVHQADERSIFADSFIL